MNRAERSALGRALGKLNRGKTKTLSPAERLARAARLAIARASRWPAKPKGKS